MRKPVVSRRRFLASAGAGGAALALGGGGAAPATGAPPEQAAGGVSPELVGQLAQYADLPLSAERAAVVAPLLASALAALREVQVPGYENLQPADVFRVPPEG